MALAVTSYDWVKTFHVLAAVIWAGGGLMVTILALLTLRQNDPAHLARLTTQIAWVGQRVFTPASIVTFGLGFAVVENDRSPWSYDDFFVVYGLVGWFLSFLNGAVYLGPRAAKIGKLLAERGPEDAETQALIRRVLVFARVDSLLVLSIVFFMTLKPFL